MRRTTAKEHRASGGIYPSPDSSAWSSYRDLLVGPVPDDDALTSLARMPGPAALRALLREGAPIPLGVPGADAMFADLPERIWEWPGARDFGAVLLLDPWPLSPVRARRLDGAAEPGGYLVDARLAVPPERTIYVPDPECGALAHECETFREARDRMPPDWRGRLDAALARIDAHIRDVESLRPALDALDALPPEERVARLAEHGLSLADASRPIFVTPRERRERLRDLARAGGWLVVSK